MESKWMDAKVEKPMIGDEVWAEVIIDDNRVRLTSGIFGDIYDGLDLDKGWADEETYGFTREEYEANRYFVQTKYAYYKWSEIGHWAYAE